MKRDGGMIKPIGSFLSGVVSGLGKWVAGLILGSVSVTAVIVFWNRVQLFFVTAGVFVGKHWSYTINVVLSLLLIVGVAMIARRRFPHRAVAYVRSKMKRSPKDVAFLLYFPLSKQLEVSLTGASNREKLVILRSKPFQDLLTNKVLVSKFAGHDIYSIDRQVYGYLKKIADQSNEHLKTTESFAKLFLIMFYSDPDYKLDRELF